MDRPAMPAPLGEVSDFNAPNPIYKYNILTQALLLSITTVLVFIRVYTKLNIMSRKSLAWDDYTCVIAWLFFLAYGTIASIQGSYFKGGQHAWNMSKVDFQNNLFWNNITQIVYGPQICFIKISILLLYANLFAPRRRTTLWYTIYVTIVCTALFYASTTLVKIWQCSPREKIWNSSLQGSCINLSALLIITGTLNLATDVFLLVLPIKKVWQLNLGTRQRIGVIAVFALGSVAPACTAVRLAVSVQTTTNPDVTFYFYGLLLWTAAEVGTAIICACLPILPAFFRHFWPKIPISSSGTQFRSGKTSSDVGGARASRASRAPRPRAIGANPYVELEHFGGSEGSNYESIVSTKKILGDSLEGGIVKTTRISQQYDR